MPLIIADNADVSASYERATLRITEQLNNRRKTASFRTIEQAVTEGTQVRIFDQLRLRTASSAGTDTLYFYDPLGIYSFTQKFRAGDRLYVGITEAGERRYTIESVNHTNGTIVLTENLAANVTMTTKVGKLRFGGLSMNPSEEEIGNQNSFLYSQKLNDYSALFDLKNVVTTFVDQYPREIAGRILKLSVAVDSLLDLHEFDDAWTEGGTGRVMLDESTDVVDGDFAQKTGVTGAGTATWTATIPTDLSDYTHVRFWWKMAEGIGVNVTSLKLRIGEDASNYFEYDIPHVGALYEDCWSYESVILAEPQATVGTPELATCDWAQLVLAADASIASGGILFDHMHATTGGFTITNVERGVSKFEQLPAGYIKPTTLLEDVFKRQSMYWFIDYEKDLHAFASSGEAAPFEINTTDLSWGDLEIERDLESLRNRVTVRGSETKATSLRTQEKVADGEQTSFTLDYKPSELKVYVAEWNGSSYDAYAEKTVGIENLDDEADFEFMMNFQEKFVRNSTFPTLDGPDIGTSHPGDKIKFTYYPYIPVRVQALDPVSIAAMKLITGGDGIYDGPIIQDERIKTFTEARRRAQVELDLYSNAIVTCKFQTNKDGLSAGQIIHIEDADRNVDDDFVIQAVSASAMAGEKDDVFSYNVTCASSMFGLIEFFQMLMRRSERIPQEVMEAVEVVLPVDDVIEIADVVNTTVKSEEFNTGDKVNYQMEFGDRTTENVTATGKFGRGVRPTWYATFTADTGSAGVRSSNYTTGKELYLTAVTGGSGKSVSLKHRRRLHVVGGNDYAVKAWIEIQAALTNIGTGGGFRLQIAEYAAQNGGSPLQTTTIFSGQTAARDFEQLAATHTMHASAAWVEIIVTIYEAAGTVGIGEIHLIDSAPDGQTNPAIAGFSQTSA